jgi:rhodanese-related sulfurtransferase
MGLLLALQFNTACSQMTYDEKLESLYKKTVPLVKPSEVKVSETAILLDTRSQQEYEVSHLPSARFLDYDRFKMKDVRDIPKDAEIIVYCSVGYRSEKIGEQLLENGYTNVRNIYGGIFQWKNDGREVLNANNQPTDSVHTYNRKWSKWLTKGVKVYD